MGQCYAKKYAPEWQDACKFNNTHARFILFFAVSLKTQPSSKCQMQKLLVAAESSLRSSNKNRKISKTAQIQWVEKGNAKLLDIY